MRKDLSPMEQLEKLPVARKRLNVGEDHDLHSMRQTENVHRGSIARRLYLRFSICAAWNHHRVVTLSSLIPPSSMTLRTRRSGTRDAASSSINTNHPTSQDRKNVAYQSQTCVRGCRRYLFSSVSRVDFRNCARCCRLEEASTYHPESWSAA